MHALHNPTNPNIKSILTIAELSMCGRRNYSVIGNSPGEARRRESERGSPWRRPPRGEDEDSLHLSSVSGLSCLNKFFRSQDDSSFGIFRFSSTQTHEKHANRQQTDSSNVETTLRRRSYQNSKKQ